MHKTTAFLLILMLAALANARIVKKKTLKRQIFDTINFDDGYEKSKLSPKNIKVKGYKYDPPKYVPPFEPSTYIPPTETSTPGKKYIIPTRGPTRKPSIISLKPIPPYTGTFPPYNYSTNSYIYTGIYPTPPIPLKPLVITTTTPRPIGYIYGQPEKEFTVEDLRNQKLK